MVSTCNKRQSNRRLPSQLDDFDQYTVIGNVASERKEIIVVIEGTNGRGFTLSTSSKNIAKIESTVSVKTLEKCFNESIDREISINVDTAEDRIQNAILTAFDNIVAPKIEFAIISINASSGRDATCVTAKSERGEHLGVCASFEKASGNNNLIHVSNVYDETRHDVPNKVSELSVPAIRFDQQTHTHHNSGVNATKVVNFLAKPR